MPGSLLCGYANRSVLTTGGPEMSAFNFRPSVFLANR